jgi:hypothetical protein
MKKIKVDPEKLPPEILNLSNDLIKILNKSVDSNLNNLLYKKENKSQNWSDLILKNSIPEDINDWSSKDFAHWFAKELNSKINIPYVIEYSRDCSSIKRIKDKFISVGFSGNQMVKDFIEWCISQYKEIKENSNRFDLTILHDYINQFLQEENKNEEIQERKLNFDILQEMNNECVSNNGKSMNILLKKYGLPLTYQYYKQKGYEIDKIIEGISLRLYHFKEKDIETLKEIAKKSIDFSPYPNWFGLLDWRLKYIDIFKSLKTMKWWREQDYSGNYVVEYENFKEK